MKIEGTPGLEEYQKSMQEAKQLLNRLKQGGSMLSTALSKNDIVQAKQIQELWFELARTLFTKLELATLIHQQYLTGNSVVITSNGKLKKVEDIMNMNPDDFDAWTLLSVIKLHEVFGPEYYEILEIKSDQKDIPIQ